MNPVPIHQIEVLAAHTVETYSGVSGQSYVSGHAAAMDCKKILAVIDGMIFDTIYQCDDCGKYSDHLDLCYYCGGEPTPVQLLSKRRQRASKR